MLFFFFFFFFFFLHFKISLQLLKLFRRLLQHCSAVKLIGMGAGT